MRGVVVGSVLMLAWQASAFQCTRAGSNGPSLAWEERALQIRAHEDNAAELSFLEIADALVFAAAQWDAVACSDFSVEVGPATELDRIGFDWAAGRGNAPNENVVVFRNEDDDVGRWLHADTAIAITTVSFELATGEILDADIELNDARYTFTACEIGCQPQHDLKNTLTHELGHALGLDHPPSSQQGALEATMFASTNVGDLAKRSLATDDVNGLCAIYRTDDETGECFGIGRTDPGHVVVRPGCGSSGETPAWIALVSLALVLNSRRLRRSGYLERTCRD